MTVIEHLDTPQLSAALDGQWDETVEGHLAACSMCREELELWRSTLAPLGEAPAPTAAAVVEAAVHAAVMEGSPTVGRRARTGVRLIGASRIAAAVAVVVGVVGSVLILSHAGHDHRAEARQVASGTAAHAPSRGPEVASGGPVGGATQEPTRSPRSVPPSTAGAPASSGSAGGAASSGSSGHAPAPRPSTGGTTGSSGVVPESGLQAAPALGQVDSPAALKVDLTRDLPTTSSSPVTVSTVPTAAPLRCATASQLLAGSAVGAPVYRATIVFEGQHGEVFVYGKPGAFVAWVLSPGCSLLTTIGI